MFSTIRNLAAASLAAAALLALAPGCASTVPAAPSGGEEQADQEGGRWKYLVEAGATATGGNSVARDIDVRFDAKGSWGADGLSTFARTEFGEAEDASGDVVRNRNRQTAGIQYRRVFDEESELFGFASQDFERDEFQDIRLRSQTFAGVGARLYKSERHEVSAQAGPGYVSTDNNNDDNSSEFSAKASQKWEWMISKDWKFLEGFEFISNLEDYDNDFRTITTADLRTDLSESLYLSIGLEHRYDAAPGIDDDGDRVKRQDYKLMLKLGFSF